MNKSTDFSEIPVIKQILKYILPVDISRTAETFLHKIPIGIFAYIRRLE